MKLEHKVTAEENGRQIQEILLSKRRFSRLLIKRIKQFGQVIVEGQAKLMKDLVYTNQIIHINYLSPEGEVTSTIASVSDIDILFQDEWLIICNKPAHLVTHPTYLHHQDNLTARLSSKRLHPVNRLDRDTSGLVILAKNSYAHHAMTTVEITKEYWALVHNAEIPNSGFIDLPIAREKGSIMLREINPDGQKALSLYNCEKRWLHSQASWLSYRLSTGRTHQLRLHSLASGWPIIGETLYGCNRFFDNWPRLRPLFPKSEAKLSADAIIKQNPGASYQGQFLPPREKNGDLKHLKPQNLHYELCLSWDKIMPRQALHAHYLAFGHPITGEKLKIHAPWPADMVKLYNALEDYEQNFANNNSSI